MKKEKLLFVGDMGEIGHAITIGEEECFVIRGPRRYQSYIRVRTEQGMRPFAVAVSPYTNGRLAAEASMQCAKELNKVIEECLVRHGMLRAGDQGEEV